MSLLMASAAARLAARRRRVVWTLGGALVAGLLPWLGACQAAPPEAGSPGAQASSPTAAAAPAPTQQLGIDFRVPPTRAPAKPSVAPVTSPFAVASPSPSATPGS